MPIGRPPVDGTGHSHRWGLVFLASIAYADEQLGIGPPGQRLEHSFSSTRSTQNTQTKGASRWTGRLFIPVGAS